MNINLLYDDEEFVRLNYTNIKPYYYISNYGRIYSVKKNKIMKPFIDKDGYFRIELATTGQRKCKKYYVHRLVGFMFVSGYFDGAMINHINSNRQCNFYKNLEWVTAQGNTDHAKEFGFLLKNNTSEFRKLNSVHDIETAEYICKLISEGYTNKEILKLYDFDSKREKKNFNTFINDLRYKRSFVWLSNKYFKTKKEQGSTTIESILYINIE